MRPGRAADHSRPSSAAVMGHTRSVTGSLYLYLVVVVAVVAAAAAVAAVVVVMVVVVERVKESEWYHCGP